jgi:hypothetical protein
MDILSLIQEARTERAKGSSEGRTKGLTSGKKVHSRAEKSKVPVEKSIRVGATKHPVGTTFTTKNADRLYVVTKAGDNKKDKESTYAGGKTAKGFTPGAKNLTTGASLKDVNDFGKRRRKEVRGSKTTKDKQ